MAKNVPKVTQTSGKVVTDAEAFTKWNSELKNNVRKKETLATAKLACEKAMSQKLASDKSKIFACWMQWANTHWDSRGAVKNAIEVKEDVSSALMAVSGKATDKTRRKVSTIAMKLKDAIKRVLPWTKVEGRRAISRILPEPELTDNGSIGNVVACHAKLHSLVAVVRRTFNGTSGPVTQSEVEIDVAELDQTENGAPEQL